MKVLQNGIGESLGDYLATTRPLQLSGAVWWVYSVTGVDASGTAGQDREKPLATLAQAVTNASAGDIIVLQDGHTETLTAPQSIAKALCIVGAGSSGGKPTATLKINAASSDILDISSAGCEVRNVYFPASVQSNTGTGKVNVTAATTRITGCYFEESGLDQLPAIVIGTGATGMRITNTTIISTATAVATRPTYGIYCNVAAITDLEMNGCILSDGTVGFSTAAFDCSANSMSRFKCESLSLLLGATMKHHASTTGWLNVGTSTGGSKVSW